MIDVKELRIGNRVMAHHEIPSIVEGVQSLMVSVRQEQYGGQYYTPAQLKPILITPDVLVSMGFVESVMVNWGTYSKPNFTISICNTDNLSFTKGQVFAGPASTPVTAIHRLQNLYFAITGLEI